MMETKYNHKQVEAGKDQKWQDNKYFSRHDPSQKPFTIILPPPNITGKLHLGHAWDAYLQDTMIRYKKLAGYDVLWIPGIDHAGIATQAKVEEWLHQETGLTKHNLGRQGFINKIWQWQETQVHVIRKQWHKLGLALDYAHERFTLDKNLSRVVSQVFIDLYRRKLIFRGQRSVHFDVKLKTVLSNIEVVNKPVKQKMFYIKYNLHEGGVVTIATVRPETLFADVALAIHPDDTRHQHLRGTYAIHPLTQRRLPVLTDTSIDMQKGTGVMKVSAHAEPDITILTTHKMPIMECINDDGLLNEMAMEFQGLERFAAREKIVAKLEQAGKIAKIETTTSAVGVSQRSQTITETLVKPQWFVKMDVMARLILTDLEANGVSFFPPRFRDNLKQWMESAHDWCISRQLWWGHRIPAWYKDHNIKVQVSQPGPGWKQDEDVLDTWFSSGLAPFSFLGWPHEKARLLRYYPTSLLVTGYDIIFFWVARMYFQALDIMKQKPFQAVLIHGLVRAADGKKMSKSLGNGIDPMGVIEHYGADALRWFLLTNAAPGQDLRYSLTKIKAAWNLNNKLWNIARYILKVMLPGDSIPGAADVWINNQLVKLKAYIDAKIDNYDFTIIGKKIYQFIMEDFSTWYIEIKKTQPHWEFAKTILQKSLIVIHPFLPFITDHIYHLMGQELLEVTGPKLQLMPVQIKLTRAISITKLLRKFRAEKTISNKDMLCYYTDMPLTPFEISIINKLANACVVKNADALIAYRKHKIFVKLSAKRKAHEQARFAREREKLRQEIARSQGMLSNPGFVKNAPPKKLQAEKDKLTRYEQELKNLM